MEPKRAQGPRNAGRAKRLEKSESVAVVAKKKKKKKQTGWVVVAGRAPDAALLRCFLDGSRRSVASSLRRAAARH